MKIDTFKKLVRELIQQELEEASVSSATPGYMTPNAFSGKKIRKKKIKEAADISALRARMKAEMDKVAKHRDDVKKHSGKFVDKAKNALKRQKAAQARVDALQDRIIGIKRENVKAALKEGKYHDWRNDDSLSAKQKIGLSMREVKGALDEIDKLIKMNVRLKNEMGVDSTSYWKRTHSAMRKISERLVKIAHKVGKLY
jgi:hypothetical protein